LTAVLTFFALCVNLLVLTVIPVAAVQEKRFGTLMNTTGIRATGDASPLPQSPLSPPAAMAQGRVVAADKSPAAVRRVAWSSDDRQGEDAQAQGPRAAPVEQVAGQEPGSGPGPVALPDTLLYQIFSCLKIGDLMPCMRVSRQWRRWACDAHVQRRCLMRTYRGVHRQQLERAVASGAMRPDVAGRCAAMDRDLARGQQAAAHAAPPSGHLLLAVIPILLQAGRLAPLATNMSPSLHGDIEQLLCSPDGRWLASSRKLPGERCSIVDLWQAAPGPAARLHSDASYASASMLACQLAFSSDSLHLGVLYDKGHQQVWRAGAQGHWQAVPRAPLFDGAVVKVLPSPDGQYLAVVLRNRVLIFGEGERGGWSEVIQWSSAWPNVQDLFSLSSGQLALQFSDDSRAFVFAFGRQGLVCSRWGRDWQEQRLLLGEPVRGQPVFAGHGRLFALATGPASDQGWSTVVQIRFWLFDRGRWVAALDPDRRGSCQVLGARAHPQAGYRVPMAFSPDDKLMAVPSGDNCRDVRVLPVVGLSVRSGGVKLVHWRAGSQQAPFDCLQRQQFSASSDFLAVFTDQTVNIWQRYPHFHRVLMVDNPVASAGAPFAFSPDGYHCALSGRNRNLVGVWGPDGDGQYMRKCLFTVPEGRRVERLLFTPEGTRVLMVLSGRHIQPLDSTEEFDFCYTNMLLSFHLVPSLPVSRRPNRRQDAAVPPSS